jgi:hypothetical protein
MSAFGGAEEVGQRQAEQAGAADLKETATGDVEASGRGKKPVVS